MISKNIIIKNKNIRIQAFLCGGAIGGAIKPKHDMH